MNIALTRSNACFLLIGWVLVFMIFLTRLPVFLQQPVELSMGITLDFLITIPFLYFLAIKDRKVPKITVLSVAIIGLILASFIIPAEHQAPLDKIKLFAIPCLELGLLGFVFFKARAIYKSAQNKRGIASVDFYDLILASCTEVLPERIGRVLATEIAVLYYGFFPLRTTKSSYSSFTYFKKNRIRSTIAAFLFIILIEAIAVHLILYQSAPRIAWVLAFLSLYTAIQVFALIRSIPNRPILYDDEKEILIVRYGFISEARIPISNIQSIELHTRALAENSEIIQFSPLGILDSNNLIVHLKKEDVFHRMYGLRKRYTSLALYIDEKEAFKKLIDSKLEEEL